MHKLNFLTEENINYIKENYKLPVYVYSEQKLLNAVKKFKDFPSAFWADVRYAMKANSNKNILKLFNKNDIKIDASSEYEVYRAINAWYKWSDIQISWQELTENLEMLLDTWVFFVATSLEQISRIWDLRPWSEIGLRINPWVWSWAFKAISTGWATSSFGIWYEYIPKIKELVAAHWLKVTKIHIHIGSENTPESWVKTASIWLNFVEEFENVKCLNMWWGFKKAIMSYESDANLLDIWEAVQEKIEDFYDKTWREIKLELEPGKYMVINSCSVIAKVIDIMDTWDMWYKFLRTNTWMTEMPRVSMYGIQQPIIVVNNNEWNKAYVIVWHCCESWDILTSKLYDQEVIEPLSTKEADIWDIIVIEGTWAYNSSMSMKNYNSFPEAAELLIRTDWSIVEIRKREQVQEIWRNELDIEI